MKVDALYRLLPAIYRIRDIERGRPLQAFMQVLGEQAPHLHDDIERLYDNWFIETCDDWVVPYLGELVGFRRGSPIGEPGDAAVSQSLELLRRLYPRREISQLVNVRRRKGTLSVFERLARNVAGWNARVVEESRWVVIAWIARYACLLKRGAIDLRDPERRVRVSTPFDTSMRSI